MWEVVTVVHEPEIVPDVPRQLHVIGDRLANLVQLKELSLSFPPKPAPGYISSIWLVPCILNAPCFVKAPVPLEEPSKEVSLLIFTSNLIANVRDWLSFLWV